jgi:hypothetical protein
MLEAALSKTTTRSGVRIAQTPEEKITAGLQEARSGLLGVADGLFPIVIGALALASSQVNGTRQAANLLFLIGLGLVLLVCFFTIYLRVKSRRALKLVSGMMVPWYALSKILTISAGILCLITIAMPFGFPLFDGPAWELTTKSTLGSVAVGGIFIGIIVALASIAAGLEALAWIGNIRRDLRVTTPSTGQRPMKPADQPPTQPNLAQT